MRKLIYAINLSIHGCCDHTHMLPPKKILFSKTLKKVEGENRFVIQPLLVGDPSRSSFCSHSSFREHGF